MDTTHPKYIKNFNEHEKTIDLLNNNLNDKILKAINYHKWVIPDATIIDSSKSFKYVNTINLANIWDHEFKKIKTLGDFQIAKYKLYYQADLIVYNGLLYFQKYFLKKKLEAPK